MKITYKAVITYANLKELRKRFETTKDMDESYNIQKLLIELPKNTENARIERIRRQIEVLSYLTTVSINPTNKLNTYTYNVYLTKGLFCKGDIIKIDILPFNVSGSSRANNSPFGQNSICSTKPK